MPKQSRNTIFNDAVMTVSNNKRVVIIRREPKHKFDSKNVILFKALTNDVGKDPGVIHELSSNEKIKYTHLGLSDEALVSLYHCLKEYINKFKKPDNHV